MNIICEQVEFEYFKFPAGECHIKIKSIITQSGIINIISNIINSDDIMYLLLFVDAIRRIDSSYVIHLYIPYFPYSRQDRVCNYGDPFSLYVMANLINGLNCNSVTVYDAHSDVLRSLVKNIVIIQNYYFILKSELKKKIIDEHLVIISPDKGAEEKINTLYNEFKKETGFQFDILYANKVRCTETGKIIETCITGGFNGKNCIIIDDICDGGATFIEIAKILKEKCNKLYLCVTHGIFSKGFNELDKYFDEIYCSNDLFGNLSKHKHKSIRFIKLNQ